MDTTFCIMQENAREPMIMEIIGQVSWQGMLHQGVPIGQTKSTPSPATTIRSIANWGIENLMEIFQVTLGVAETAQGA
eukprot:3392252-Ditylum_brightwellii.AAC.1